MVNLLERGCTGFSFEAIGRTFGPVVPLVMLETLMPSSYRFCFHLVSLISLL